jgi:hypothetical protein
VTKTIKKQWEYQIRAVAGKRGSTTKGPRQRVMMNNESVWQMMRAATKRTRVDETQRYQLCHYDVVVAQLLALGFIKSV